MTWHAVEVDTYNVFVRSQAPGHSDGLAYLWFGDDSEDYVYAQLSFAAGIDPLQSNVMADHPTFGKKYFRAYFDLEAQASVIALLQHDKPIYFHFDDETRQVRISTGREPVGEDEPNHG